MNAAPPREPSLIDLGLMLLRHRRLLLVTPLVVAGLALVLLLVRGRQYVAESAFRPQVSDGSTGRLAGLAAQLGVNLPGAALGDPVRFYSELARSKDLLRDVALSQYRFRTPAGDSLAGTLIELLHAKGDTPDLAAQNAVVKLTKALDISSNRDAGMVRIQVVTRWPELSELINRRILRAIDTANQVRRQSQAAAERHFIERRLQDAQDELAGAERNQERFLQQNRQYQNSPQLVLEFSRLQRQVDLRQQLYSTLAQAYEQARIDEVRDTPQLTIIDRPEGSAHKAGSLVKDVAMWLVIGMVLGVLFALAGEFLQRQGEQDPEGYHRLRSLLPWPLRPR